MEVRGRSVHVYGVGVPSPMCLEADDRSLNFVFCKMDILDVHTTQTGRSRAQRRVKPLVGWRPGSVLISEPASARPRPRGAAAAARAEPRLGG